MQLQYFLALMRSKELAGSARKFKQNATVCTFLRTNFCLRSLHSFHSLSRYFLLVKIYLTGSKNCARFYEQTSVYVLCGSVHSFYSRLTVPHFTSQTPSISIENWKFSSYPSVDLNDDETCTVIATMLVTYKSITFVYWTIKIINNATTFVYHILRCKHSSF